MTTYNKNNLIIGKWYNPIWRIKNLYYSVIGFLKAKLVLLFFIATILVCVALGVLYTSEKLADFLVTEFSYPTVSLK